MPLRPNACSKRAAVILETGTQGAYRTSVDPGSISYRLRVALISVVAWIGAEVEFALSQAVASGDAFEHRTSECGHCVQDFLTDLDHRDLPGEAAGLELGADDALPAFDSAPTATAPLPPVALCQAIPSSLRIWATARSPLTGKAVP